MVSMVSNRWGLVMMKMSNGRRSALFFGGGGRSALGLAFSALGSLGCAQASAQSITFPATRDPTVWPFLASGPFNTPLNNGDAPVPITAPAWGPGYQINLNWQANTTSVIRAQPGDPVWTLYDNLYLRFPPSPPPSNWQTTYKYNNSVWYLLHAPPYPYYEGIPPAPSQTWCQPANSSDAAVFLQRSVSPTYASLYPNYPNNNPFGYNPWADPNDLANPMFNNIALGYNQTFIMPGDASKNNFVCGSPDSDGWTTVTQPQYSHFAVDLYAPIVSPSSLNAAGQGNIVFAHGIGSWIDLEAGDGSGAQNGRRATMIPALAGLIRQGEVNPSGPTKGFIPHALAAVIGPDMLSYMPVPPLMITGAAWPAYAIDSSPTDSCTKGCLPLGALLAVPPNVNLLSHTWQHPQDYAIALAAQYYGIYIVATGSKGSMNILAELNDPDLYSLNMNDVAGPDTLSDGQYLQSVLQLVTTNSQQSPGGLGSPIYSLPPVPPFTY
jgi:hypothetical protein